MKNEILWLLKLKYLCERALIVLSNLSFVCYIVYLDFYMTFFCLNLPHSFAENAALKFFVYEK